jgi:hypothetical protein
MRRQLYTLLKNIATTTGRVPRYLEKFGQRPQCSVKLLFTKIKKILAIAAMAVSTAAIPFHWAASMFKRDAPVKRLQ